MADRSCDYCDDRGDCDRCSPFFQPDAIHTKCGRSWREHKRHSNMAPYPGYSTCPKEA